MKQLLLICGKNDAHMAINKNKLIEARWKNIHKPEPDKEIKTLKAFLLEPLSVERSLMCYTQPESLYFHFGTFSLLAKLVQVFFSLHASSAFVRKGRENRCGLGNDSCRM